MTAQRDGDGGGAAEVWPGRFGPANGDATAGRVDEAVYGTAAAAQGQNGLRVARSVSS